MKNQASKNRIVAKTFFGLEEVCINELKSIGANGIQKLNRAVAFDFNKEILYKANLWSRTALAFLVNIEEFSFHDQDDFYNKLKAINWDNYFNVNKTIFIKSIINRTHFDNSHFVSLRAKDAIVDYFRDKYNKRPSVDSENPDVKLEFYLNGDKCLVSLDSSGESLFKRGYRKIHGEAPINEALAASLLLLSGYKPGKLLIDPMCGSGTFAIEASLIATNTAPGLLRKDYCFKNWNDYDESLWKKILSEAKSQVNDNQFEIIAFDINGKSVDAARQNILRAGMLGRIKLSRKDFFKFNPPSKPGIIIMNPPYGQRLKNENLLEFYRNIGRKLKFNYSGYKAWIISSEISAIQKIGLKPEAKYKLLNGKIECRFDGYSLYDGSKRENKKPGKPF